MAKVAKTAIRKGAQQDVDAKSFTKVIKSIKNPKTGAYSFREKMIHKDKVDEFLAAK